jgi:hypothetical protein
LYYLRKNIFSKKNHVAKEPEDLKSEDRGFGDRRFL